MLEIDLKSRKSIYEQVMDGIKELIIAGVYKKDDRLPSVRELAAEIIVNPNTVQKAFRSLEQQGWIYTVSGRGCFVSGMDGLADEKARKELFERLNAVVKELFFTGVSMEEIIGEIKKVKGGDSK